jgi:alkanesulfonate monooxygenase SsuD/methylene tetrahydromethanopterin reductase-like flavin-dependent oxidoreductase (luciferase family)
LISLSRANGCSICAKPSPPSRLCGLKRRSQNALLRNGFEFHRQISAAKPPQPIGVHSPGYVADTDEQVREELWPDYKQMRDRIGAERGWPPIGRSEFDREIDEGSLYVGAPETVARKIAATVKALDVTRFDMKYSAGQLSHEKLLHSIELYGSNVIPLVREMLA